MEIFRLTGSVIIDGIEAAETSLNKLGNSLGNLGSTISRFGNSMINNVSKPIIDLIGSGIKYGATLEDLTTKFEVLTGSQKKAAKLMKDIREISRTTPFQTESLAEAASIMLNYGIANEKVLPTLTMLGDVAMGNNEHFKMLTYNMSQVAAAGKLQGMDLKSLVLAGWNPLRTIMETTGETMDDVKQRMSDGAISYEEVEKALKKVTSEGGRFHDGMAKGSLTLNGRISTLTDTFKEFSFEISKPIFEKLKELVPQVTNVLTKLSEGFNSLSKDGKNAVLFIGLLTAALPVLIVAVGSVIAGLGGFLLVVSALLTPIGLISSAIGILISGSALGGLIALLINLPNINFNKWKAEFETLKNKAIEIYGYFEKTWKPAIKYLLTDDPVELAKIKDTGFRDSIENLRKVIEDFTDNANAKFGNIIKSFKNISKQDVAKFSKDIADIASSLVKMAKVSGQIIELFNVVGKPLIDPAGAIKENEKKGDFFDQLLKNRNKEETVKKKVKVDVEIDDTPAKKKIDFSNNSLKTKSIESIPNVLKKWSTDSLINDMPAKKKTDTSNSLIKSKSLEVIPNVTKYWSTDSNINDKPAKTKADASNKEIRNKAGQIIPNQTKQFALFANIDISGALSSIGNAFSSLKKKITSYGSNIISNIRIPGFASGVSNYAGGLAMVGENGPELVNLPKGSDVYTASETRRMINNNGLTSSNSNSNNIFNVTIDARNIKDFNDVVSVFSRIKTEKITRLGY